MWHCAEQLDRFLANAIKNGDGTFETKTAFSSYTIDVISSCAFATITDANADPERKSPFHYHAFNLFNFNLFKVLATLFLPAPVLNVLNIKTNFPENSFKFFHDLVLKIVNDRKQNMLRGIKNRVDLIQLMLEASVDSAELNEKGNKPDNLSEKSSSKSRKTLDEKEIIAQCLVIFIAGFETSATVSTHLLFELAKNQDIQERLYEEIKLQTTSIDKSNIEEYCDLLLSNKLPYLEACINESMRL